MMPMSIGCACLTSHGEGHLHTLFGRRSTVVCFRSSVDGRRSTIVWSTIDDCPVDDRRATIDDRQLSGRRSTIVQSTIVSRRWTIFGCRSWVDDRRLSVVGRQSSVVASRPWCSMVFHVSAPDPMLLSCCFTCETVKMKNQKWIFARAETLDIIKLRAIDAF